MQQSPQSPPSAESATRRKPQKSLYSAIWRWHFWGGFLIAPFLVIVSITGALYVFERELSVWLEPEIHQVSVPEEGAMKPFSERLTAARAAISGEWEFSSFFRSGGPDSSDAIVFDPKTEPEEADDHEHRHVYVNPYTAEVLSDGSQTHEFFETVLDLHRTLLAGKAGRFFVEASTCWGAVSMLTGIFLWWPRLKEKVWGVWLPRLRHGLRIALRDLHAIPGLYLSLVILAIMLTGLLYTQIWGKAAFAGLFFGGQLPAPYVSPPKSTSLKEGASPVGIDRIMEEARSHYAYERFFLVSPHNPEDAWTIYGHTQAGDLSEGAVYIDASTGDTLATIDYPSMALGAKIALLFYSIHTGSIFGMPTKILAVISCIIIAGMTITGVWMWWRRRPSGKLGAPAKRKHERVPKGVVILIIGLSIFFPTVGVSILLIALVSWIASLIRRRRHSPA